MSTSYFVFTAKQALRNLILTSFTFQLIVWTSIDDGSARSYCTVCYNPAGINTYRFLSSIFTSLKNSALSLPQSLLFGSKMEDTNSPGPSRPSSRRKRKRSELQESHPEAADLAQTQATRAPSRDSTGQSGEATTSSSASTSTKRTTRSQTKSTTPVQHDDDNDVNPRHPLPSSKGEASPASKRTGLPSKALKKPHSNAAFQAQQTQATSQTVQTPLNIPKFPGDKKPWDERANQFVLAQVPRYYDENVWYNENDLMRDFKKGNFGFEITFNGILGRYRKIKKWLEENQDG